MRSLREAMVSAGLGQALSRRDFLKVSGMTVVGLSALGALESRGERTALILLDKANGIVIADPTKCVGCRRCELACTEFNDGRASPTISRIKVGRNLNFGPKGLFNGRVAQGNWGNGTIVQELCKQCPHPVPCANACPNDAIVIKPPTNARVVDPDKCVGCRMCLRACPWGMMSFDADSNQATKCFLCNGSPKCVEACPAEALSYMPWQDVTDKVEPRFAPTVGMAPAKAAACTDCHKR